MDRGLLATVSLTRQRIVGAYRSPALGRSRRAPLARSTPRSEVASTVALEVRPLGLRRMSPRALFGVGPGFAVRRWDTAPQVSTTSEPSRNFALGQIRQKRFKYSAEPEWECSASKARAGGRVQGVACQRYLPWGAVRHPGVMFVGADPTESSRGQPLRERHCGCSIRQCNTNNTHVCQVPRV